MRPDIPAASGLSNQHGLGPLHPRASRTHPPPEQTRLVPSLVPRSLWQRLAASVSVFVLGQSVGAWLVHGATGHAPELLFKAVMLTTWVGPVVAWFALRHRKLGDEPIQGHPLNVLAQMSLGVSQGWLELRVPEEDLMSSVDDDAEPSSTKPKRLELVASEDLVASFGAAYVRARSGSASDQRGEVPSQAHAAIDTLSKAITHELGLFEGQVWELESSASEDIDEEIGGHIEHVSFVIKRGQWRDTDEVCGALQRAVDTLRAQFALTAGEP